MEDVITPFTIAYRIVRRDYINELMKDTPPGEITFKNLTLTKVAMSRHIFSSRKHTAGSQLYESTKRKKPRIQYSFSKL